jgi:hypothetical protein
LVQSFPKSTGAFRNGEAKIGGRVRLGMNVVSKISRKSFVINRSITGCIFDWKRVSQVVILSLILYLSLSLIIWAPLSMVTHLSYFFILFFQPFPSFHPIFEKLTSKIRGHRFAIHLHLDRTYNQLHHFKPLMLINP